jgi:hypothetical protein
MLTSLPHEKLSGPATVSDDLSVLNAATVASTVMDKHGRQDHHGQCIE